MTKELNIQNQKIDRLKVELIRNENTLEYFKTALMKQIYKLKIINKIEKNITDSLPFYMPSVSVTCVINGNVFIKLCAFSNSRSRRIRTEKSKTSQ